MAASLFDPGREGFLTAEIDWDSSLIKVAMVRGYAFNAAHKFVSQVTGAGGKLHAISPALASKTFAAGVADAADVTFTSPAANATGHSLLIFQSSAVGGSTDVAQASQRLIGWIDTGNNMPIVPNGSNVTIQWGSGSDRIFKL